MGCGGARVRDWKGERGEQRRARSAKSGRMVSAQDSSRASARPLTRRGHSTHTAASARAPSSRRVRARVRGANGIRRQLHSTRHGGLDALRERTTAASTRAECEGESAQTAPGTWCQLHSTARVRVRVHWHDSPRRAAVHARAEAEAGMGTRDRGRGYEGRGRKKQGNKGGEGMRRWDEGCGGRGPRAMCLATRLLIPHGGRRRRQRHPNEPENSTFPYSEPAAALAGVARHACDARASIDASAPTWTGHGQAGYRRNTSVCALAASGSRVGDGERWGMGMKRECVEDAPPPRACLREVCAGLVAPCEHRTQRAARDSTVPVLGGSAGERRRRAGTAGECTSAGPTRAQMRCQVPRAETSPRNEGLDTHSIRMRVRTAAVPTRVVGGQSDTAREYTAAGPSTRRCDAQPAGRGTSLRTLQYPPHFLHMWGLNAHGMRACRYTRAECGRGCAAGTWG
ncbi:hypothetical protein B0H13DRAFT_1865096 [Mycena leptocephala]|nr:hypothetical protein B0H13DRAFT_1865096 [Mycena leptocephala]